MTPETQAAIFFAVGMLGFMGLGMPMALALVLTGAGMAWLCLLYTSPSPRD